MCIRDRTTLHWIWSLLSCSSTCQRLITGHHANICSTDNESAYILTHLSGKVSERHSPTLSPSIRWWSRALGSGKRLWWVHVRRNRRISAHLVATKLSMIDFAMWTNIELSEEYLDHYFLFSMFHVELFLFPIKSKQFLLQIMTKKTPDLMCVPFPWKFQYIRCSMYVCMYVCMKYVLYDKYAKQH